MDGQLIQRWMKSCRLCLLDDGVKLPIFGEEGIVREVAHKIQSCFPIVLYNTDPLSKIICQRCLFMLDTVYSFRQKCVETNEVFTSHLLGLKSNSSSVKQYLQALEKSKAPVAGSTIPQISSIARNDHRRSAPTDNRPTSYRGESDPLANTVNEGFTPPALVRIKQEPGTKPPPKSVPKIISVVGSYSDNVIPTASAASRSPFAVPHAVRVKQEFGAMRARAKRNFKLLTPWHCKFCKKYYKTKGTLYKHRKYFCPFKTLSCGKCNQVFLNESERLQHWATHLRVHVNLKEEDLHSCPICKRRFAYKAVLQNHLKVHEGDDNQYTLHTNEAQSADVSGVVRRGALGDSDSERFKCEICFRSYSRRTKLNFHIKHVHRAEWLAMNRNRIAEPISEMSESDTEDLNGSGATNPLIPKYRPAPLSKQKFRKDSNGLLRELLSKPKCEICLKVFTNRSGLTNHMRSHGPKNPHRCVVCGRLFASKKGLLCHEKVKHGGYSAPRDAYRCRSCNRNFKTRSEWLLHTLTHDKTKKAKSTDEQALASTKLLLCSYCNQVFSDSAEYKQHMQTHKVVSPGSVHMSATSPDMQAQSWACNLCNKTFAKKRNLTRHQAAHAARLHSSHPCNICDKQFLSRASLLRHVPMHSNPSLSKTFHCSICNKIFFKIEALQNHACTPGVQTGSGENPDDLLEDQLMDQPFQDGTLQSEDSKDELYRSKPYLKHLLESEVLASEPVQKAPQNCNFCGYARFKGHQCLYRKDSSASLTHTAKKVMNKTYNRLTSYKCRVCAATFASSYSHNSHMKVHKKGRYYKPILNVPSVVDRQSPAMSQLVDTFEPVAFVADDSEGTGSITDPTTPLDLRCIAPTASVTDAEVSGVVPVSFEGVSIEPLYPGTHLLAAIEGDGSGLEPVYLPETAPDPPPSSDVYYDQNEFYQCSQCPKTFHSDEEVALHAKSHEAMVQVEIPYQCPFCPLTFTDTEVVDQHILQDHQEARRESIDKE